MIFPFDLHLHSLDFSGDAVSYMDEMCAGAVEKGLKRICFTEHVDFDPHYDDSIPFDAAKYDDYIDAMRQKYGAQIEILKGIEVGEPHKYRQQYEQLLSYGYDLVMVGLHYIDIAMGLHWTGNGGRDIFTYAPDRIYRRYYEELLAIVELGGFDVLAHIDYPKRYLGKDADEDELLRQIIERLVAGGGLLEINTSPWRKGCKEPAPGRKILEIYKNAGGKRLTIGSDAHAVQDIGAGVDRALLLAEDFEKGYFKGRKFYALD